MKALFTLLSRLAMLAVVASAALASPIPIVTSPYEWSALNAYMQFVPVPFNPGASSSPITLDSHCTNQSGATSVSTISCSSNLVEAGGETIVCASESENNGYYPVTISDSVNGNYMAALMESNSSPSPAVPLLVGVMFNAGAGSYEPTATFTTADEATGIQCFSFNNVRTTAVLDSAAGINQFQNKQATTNPQGGTAVSPTGNGEAIVGIATMSTKTASIGTGFTLVQSPGACNTQPVSDCMYMEYEIQTTAASTDAPFSSTSDNWTSFALALLPSTASAGATPFSGPLMNLNSTTNGTTITTAILDASTLGPGSAYWTWSGTTPTAYKATNTPAPEAFCTSKYINGVSYSGSSGLTAEYTTTATPPAYPQYWFGGAAETASWAHANAAVWVQWDVPNTDTKDYDVISTANAQSGNLEYVSAYLDNGSLIPEYAVAGNGDTCLTGCSGVAVSPNTWYFITVAGNKGGTHEVQVFNSSCVNILTSTASQGTSLGFAEASFGPNGGEAETAGDHFYFANWLANFYDPSTTGITP